MNEKPIRPDDSECCGSGCKPCIFDVYEERLKKWESGQKERMESVGLNVIKYLPFRVVSKQNVTDRVMVFKFQAVELKRESGNSVIIRNAIPEIDYSSLQGRLHIQAGEYLILKGLSEGDAESTIISRSYTPVLNQTDFDNGTFMTIISLLDKGKMSQFFIKLNTSDIVFWRGPYQELEYKSNSFEHVLFIGGGTGVVPLYNISKTIVENDDDNTWVNVLCSFKTVESILLRREFGELRNYWNFKMKIFVTDQNKTDFKSNYNELILMKRIDESVLFDEIIKYEQNKVFVVVSGPTSFNEFVKQNLVKLGIKEENIFIFWYLWF